MTMETKATCGPSEGRRDDNRAEWERPALRRLAAGRAENVHTLSEDKGDGAGS